MVGTQAEGLARMFAQNPLLDFPEIHSRPLPSLDDVARFVGRADLSDCKAIVDLLVERVSTLQGDASSLEDAACHLAAEIEAQDVIDNPPLCAACNGSGEGQHDGTRCVRCCGTGTDRREA